MLGLAAGAVSAHRQLVQKSLLSSGNAELTVLLASHKEAGQEVQGALHAQATESCFSAVR